MFEAAGVTQYVCHPSVIVTNTQDTQLKKRKGLLWLNGFGDFRPQPICLVALGVWWYSP